MSKRNMEKWIAEGHKLDANNPSRSLKANEYGALLDMQKADAIANAYYLGLSIGYKIADKKEA